MKKIIWRLKEQPSSESLRELVKDGILTKEEAREILFSSETEEERDKKSLESEIKFLRELVEKLSQDRGKVVEIIREIDRPYWRRESWWGPYWTWTNATTTTTPMLNSLQLSDNTISNWDNAVKFSDIKTF